MQQESHERPRVIPDGATAPIYFDVIPGGASASIRTHCKAGRNGVEQIRPMRILLLDQHALPIPPPSLQFLFPQNRPFIILEHFPIDEPVHAIAFGESRNVALFVFCYAANKVVCGWLASR